MKNFYSISTGDFRPISFDSVYLYGEYEKIKNFLASNNKEEFIRVLAVPSYKNDVIEWKAESSADIRKLDTFSKVQQEKILIQYNDFVASFNGFINTLINSKNKDNSSWGELLRSLVEGSANELFYDGENIFITWGWKLLDENSKKLIPVYVPPVKVDTSPSVVEDIVEVDPIPVIPVEEPEIIEEKEMSWLDKIYLFLKRLWWLVPILSIIILILVLLESCEDCDPVCTDIDNRLHDVDILLDNCDCCECVIRGCLDERYKEYNPNANVHDETFCLTNLEVIGCMDDTYRTYDPNANKHDKRLCRDKLKPCDSDNKAGGQRGDKNRHALGDNPGVVVIEYNTKSLPDKIEVKYNGKIVDRTNGFVGESGILCFEYDPQSGDRYCTVIVTGGPDAATEWSYTINCPERGKCP